MTACECSAECSACCDCVIEERIYDAQNDDEHEPLRLSRWTCDDCDAEFELEVAA